MALGISYNYRWYHLWNVDSWIVVSDKVDVRSGEVLADQNSPVVARLIVPLKAIAKFVIKHGHACFVAPSIGLQSAVGLSDSLRSSVAPVVMLQNKLRLFCVNHNNISTCSGSRMGHVYSRICLTFGWWVASFEGWRPRTIR